MSRSFSNFLERKQNQEFTYRFSRLCENIARSGVRWDDYCRNQLYPTLVEGAYSNPDELLDTLLNEVEQKRHWMNPMRYLSGKTYDDGKPAPAAKTKNDADYNYNWVDLGYKSNEEMSRAGPEDRKRRQAQFDAKKNGTPQPDPLANFNGFVPGPDGKMVADMSGGDLGDLGDPHGDPNAPDASIPQIPEEPAASKKGKKGGVPQERIDQETALYQKAGDAIAARFGQALQQFYAMVRDDAHKTNNSHTYEVLKHFMGKIEPAYKQALTGLKAKASSGNKTRAMFQGASRDRYNQRQKDSAANSGVKSTEGPDGTSTSTVSNTGGDGMTASIGSKWGKASPEDTAAFGPQSQDVGGAAGMTPEDMARFGPQSAMAGNSGMPAFTADVGAAGSAQPFQVPNANAGLGDGGGTATDDEMPYKSLGSPVSPDTEKAVAAQSGGYAGGQKHPLDMPEKDVNDAIYFADQPNGGDPEVKQILKQAREAGQSPEQQHHAVAAHLAKRGRSAMSQSTHGSDYDADSERSGIHDESYSYYYRRPRYRKYPV